MHLYFLRKCLKITNLDWRGFKSNQKKSWVFSCTIRRQSPVSHNSILKSCVQYNARNLFNKLPKALKKKQNFKTYKKKKPKFQLKKLLLCQRIFEFKFIYYINISFTSSSLYKSQGSVLVILLLIIFVLSTVYIVLYYTIIVHRSNYYLY